VTRGVAHPPELRAEVVAAVLAGLSIVQAAAQFGLDKGLVSRWVQSAGLQLVATDQHARKLELLEGLIFDLVAEHAVTLRAELQAAARPDWLEKQSAAELAQLVVAQRDTLIRLLAGFRPIPDQPDLSAPADAPSSAADDPG
jgi:transposase-like protein